MYRLSPSGVLHTLLLGTIFILVLLLFYYSVLLNLLVCLRNAHIGKDISGLKINYSLFILCYYGI